MGDEFLWDVDKNPTLLFIVYVVAIAYLFNILRLNQIVYAKVGIVRKIGAFIVELCHHMLVGLVIISIWWLTIDAFFFNQYNVFYLVAINVILLIVFLQYSYLNNCIFFILFGKIMDMDPYSEYYTIMDVLSGAKPPCGAEGNYHSSVQKWLCSVRLLTVNMIIVDTLYAIKYWDPDVSSKLLFIPMGFILITFVPFCYYTLEHYKPDTQRVSGSVFKGNVTGV